VSHVIALLSIL
jgi:hypothetical protein